MPPARGSDGAGFRWNYDTACALALVALGVLLFVLIPYQVARPTMMIGQMASGLQPQRFPQVVAGFLVVFGLWYLWQSRASSEPSGFASMSWSAGGRVLILLAVLLLYARLMEPLGFVPMSFLVAFGLSLFLGQRNLVLAAVVCLGVPLAAYLLFTRVLYVSLPASPLPGLPF